MSANRFRVVEMVVYKRCYATPENPRRVATVKLEDGRYIDLTEDDSGEKNFQATVVVDHKEVFLVIPVQGGKIILTGPSSQIGQMPI